jgi:hypothetical protein
VTDFSHPEANGYTVSAPTPSITWDYTENEPETTSTGDVTDIVLYVVLAVAAIVIVAVLLKRLRR